MPRLNIIILDIQRETSELRYALWADVPVARQPFYAAQAGPTAVSSWVDALPTDQTNIQLGRVVEQVEVLRVTDVSVGVRPYLQAQWAAFQARITNVNPWLRYGSTATFDGTAWTWTPSGIS